MLNKVKTGLSTQGQSIDLWVEEGEGPLTLLVGGFHGDEVEGPYLLTRFIEQLTAAGHVGKTRLAVIPCLNPDGKLLGTRENANKIDLNRNYPTANFATESYNPHTGIAKSGTPGSEVETQWFMDVMQTYSPTRILSIHSDLEMVDYDGPAADWARTIADLTGYKFVENVGYATPGSFGTWAGIERQIPVVTLETEKARSPEELAALWDKMRPLFKTFVK